MWQCKPAEKRAKSRVRSFKWKHYCFFDETFSLSHILQNPAYTSAFVRLDTFEIAHQANNRKRESRTCVSEMRWWQTMPSYGFFYIVFFPFYSFAHKRGQHFFFLSFPHLSLSSLVAALSALSYFPSETSLFVAKQTTSPVSLLSAFHITLLELSWCGLVVLIKQTSSIMSHIVDVCHEHAHLPSKLWLFSLSRSFFLSFVSTCFACVCIYNVEVNSIHCECICDMHSPRHYGMVKEYTEEKHIEVPLSLKCLFD